MGILSDIYISHDAEAIRYDTAPQSFAEQEQYQCKSITPLELSTLWAIIRGVEFDITMLGHFTCLLTVDGGERLVHSFPLLLVVALSQLTPEQIRDVSTKWAATEELACPTSDIQPIIKEMIRLACAATASGRGLYLWNSL